MTLLGMLVVGVLEKTAVMITLLDNGELVVRYDTNCIYNFV